MRWSISDPRVDGRLTKVGGQKVSCPGSVATENNVLLTTDEKYNGFIYDLDYSTYAPNLNKFASQVPGYGCQLGSLPSKITKHLEQMTVSPCVAAEHVDRVLT